MAQMAKNRLFHKCGLLPLNRKVLASWVDSRTPKRPFWALGAPKSTISSQIWDIFPNKQFGEKRAKNGPNDQKSTFSLVYTSSHESKVPSELRRLPAQNDHFRF